MAPLNSKRVSNDLKPYAIVLPEKVILMDLWLIN